MDGAPPLTGLGGHGVSSSDYAAVAERLCLSMPVPKLPERFNRRFQYRLEDGSGDEPIPEPAYVAYDPTNRLWADWIASELSRCGVTVRLVSDAVSAPPAGGAVVIVVGSPDTLPTALTHWVRSLASDQPDDASFEMLYVRLAQTDPPAPPRAHQVDLSITSGSGTPEDEASARLRAPFLIPKRKPVSANGWTTRYPLGGEPRPVVSVLAPNDRFVGRNRELEQIRTGLLSGRPQVITGAPGIGKTEIAIAYSSRFGQDYDLVWLVPASSRQAVHDSLVALRERPRPASLHDLGSYRQLIIFDAADDAGTLDRTLLDQFLPAAQDRHVIITSRTNGPIAVDQIGQALGLDCGEIPIGDLPESDAIRVLAKRLSGLRPEEGRQILHRLGSSPLVLRLAEVGITHHADLLAHRGFIRDIKALNAARDYLAALATSPTSEDDAPSAAGPAGAAAALEVIVSILGHSPNPLGRVALCLARMCSFLSPDGVSLDLLRNDAMVEQLVALVDEMAPERVPGEGTTFARDLSQFDQMLWFGDRSGLFDIDWGRTASLRMSRVVARLMRDGMSPERHDRTRAAVLAGLARYAPNEAELQIDPYHTRLRRLHRHMEPSGALEASDWAPRQWVVKQLEDVQRYGDQLARKMALKVADDVRRRWTDDPNDSADLILRLEQVRTRLHEQLGDHPTAIEMQLRLWEDLAKQFGPDHFRTLLATDLAVWMLHENGDFYKAEEQAKSLLDRVRRTFGDEHPVSLRMAHNVTWAHFLWGQVVGAQTLGRETLARTRAQTGRGHRLVWKMSTSLGFFHLYGGAYQQAGYLFEQTTNALRSESSTPETRDLLLRAQRGHAAARRASGKSVLGSDKEILAERRTLERADPRETSACLMALALDKYQLGQPEDARAAITYANEAWSLYYRRLPKRHPLRCLCQLNLAVFQYADGQGTQAAQTAAEAEQGLRDQLDFQHPWALAATVNRLNIVALTSPAADQNDIANRLEIVVGAYHDTLGHHPYTDIAETNLPEIRRGLAFHPSDPVRSTIPLKFIVIDMP